jgi:hypothetical protein
LTGATARRRVRPIKRSAEDRRAALLAEYAEVNNDFRLLTEIRFKLLALLPLAAGGAWAIFGGGSWLGNGDSASLRAGALSAFGLVVTVFVATYNSRNDQVYLWLVNRAVSIERELGVPDGSFAQRPNPWFEVQAFGIRGLVGHSSSVSAIYGSSIALWLAGGFAAAEKIAWHGPVPTWAYGAAVGVSAMLTLGAVLEIGHQKRARRRDIQDHASEAVRLAKEHDFRTNVGRRELAELEPFIKECAALIGRDWRHSARKQEVQARAAFYGGVDDEWINRCIPETCVEAPEAYYVSLIVDLPAPVLSGFPQRREGRTAPGLSTEHTPDQRVIS